jgi:type VI secretion system protein
MNNNQKINSITLFLLQKTAYVLSIFLLTISTLLLTSCTMVSPDPDFSISSVTLVVDDDANNNSATAVDMVVIYKKELLEALQSMKAKDYFKASTQIQRDYPDMVKIYRWEVVPGQIIGPQPLSLCSVGFITPCPLGGIVFANYQQPGEHRIRLGSIDHIQIHLANAQFFIEPAEKE